MYPVLILDFAAWSMPFPAWQAGLLFGIFSTVVVHVCKRLTQYAAFSLDRSSRLLSGSLAASSIGLIVWALDLAGFLMYPELQNQTPDLLHALLALLVMTVGARTTIPGLSTEMSRLAIGAHGAVLALSMLLGHGILAHGYGANHWVLHLPGLALGLLIATALSVVPTLRLRHFKLKSLQAPLAFKACWLETVLCGVAIVPLHWILVNTVPPQPSIERLTAGESWGLLVVLVLLVLAVTFEYLSNAKVDQNRQDRLRQGLSFTRAHTAGEPTSSATLSIIADHLDDILKSHHLALHFQPIVCLSEPEQTALEVLLRIQHPTLGRISPEVFFLVCDLQEKTILVDKLIIERAVKQLARWRAAGRLDIHISINVAPATLQSPSFTAWTRQTLQEHGIPHGHVTFEITEHAVISSGQEMLANLRQLESVQLKVVMDDFGAGYSSLAILGELPIVGIKCDRLFMREMLTDPRRFALLNHIRTIAHVFALSVTLEGVETEDEIKKVTSLGFDRLQGYFFSAAMSANEVMAWRNSDAVARVQALQPAAPTTLPGPTIPLLATVSVESTGAHYSPR